jgi:RNA polymerase sigma-70 factor (ECF subfamily)
MCKVLVPARFPIMAAPSERPTSPSLLLRVRDPADAAAWRAFVDVYGPLVYGHCRSRGLAHEDAEDVTQEVFARVSEGIRSFEYRPEVARFRTWLLTVVNNETCRLRQKKARTVSGTADEAALAEAAAAGAETAWTAAFNARVLHVALERSRPHFEADTWRAFELVWLEDRPAAEAARTLGRPIDWVYVAKSRVQKRLWEEVVQLADDSALPAAPRPTGESS